MPATFDCDGHFSPPYVHLHVVGGDQRGEVGGEDGEDEHGVDVGAQVQDPGH